MENETKFMRLDTDGHRWQNQRSAGQLVSRQPSAVSRQLVSLAVGQLVSGQRFVFWLVAGWWWFAFGFCPVAAG
jgi:hypothetical protein